MTNQTDNRPRGEERPGSKLTAEAVRQMRLDYAEAQRRIRELNRQYSLKALAIEHGVSEMAIKKALTGATWGHVR